MGRKDKGSEQESRNVVSESRNVSEKIPLFKVHMPKSVLGPLQDVLLSGYIGQGVKVDEFERLIGEYLGNKNVLTTNSGTSALQLALRLSDVWFGDEVISTAMTCTATNEPILAMGAKIVWADIDPTTGNISPEEIRKKITPKTKAIMAMHWGGYPPDLKEINEIAKKHNIKVIEDAAHSFGADYQGKKIGNHSDFVCFSFQAIKQLTTIDGGALICRSEDDCKRGRLLRWYGIDREEKGRTDFRCENDIKEYGYKFHMNDVCATVGIEQMKYIEKILKKNREHAKRFNDAFSSHSRIRLLGYKKDRVSAYWLYTLLVDNRAEFMAEMDRKGITVSQVHARNDKHTMFKEFLSRLPNVDIFSEKMVCIPVGWWLTDEEVDYIIKAVNNLS